MGEGRGILGLPTLRRLPRVFSPLSFLSHGFPSALRIEMLIIQTTFSVMPSPHAVPEGEA